MAVDQARALRWVTSPQTIRSYTSALPRAFAGIATVGELATEGGADRLRTNIRTAWGQAAPSTFNAKRAAVASALSYFQQQGWLPADAQPLTELGREHEPKPADRVRDRAAIDRLVTAKSRPLADRALFAMLYATAARCKEVLRLDVADLDRANRRATTTRKGGNPNTLLYDTRTARLLGQLLGKRQSGPVFLSDRAPSDGTVRSSDCDPTSGRRRLTYRTAARRLAAATGGWTPHDLRHSRLTHAGEDGATEADLMNLSGHEDRRTLQRYLHTSKEGTHRRLDGLDQQRDTWTPNTDDIAARLATGEEHEQPTPPQAPPPPAPASNEPDLVDPVPPKPAAEPSTPAASTTAGVASRSRSAEPTKKPSGSRRGRRTRYTSAELNAYQLEPVRNDSGEIQRYTVLIAGDTLGSIDRAPYRHTGWQAHQHPSGTVVPHSGKGRYATNRETAVVDLLLALGITSTTPGPR